MLDISISFKLTNYALYMLKGTELEFDKILFMSRAIIYYKCDNKKFQMRSFGNCSLPIGMFKCV